MWPDHRVAVTVGDEDGVSDRADTLQCTMIGNAPVARRCFHASYRRSFTYSGDPAVRTSVLARQTSTERHG